MAKRKRHLRLVPDANTQELDQYQARIDWIAHLALWIEEGDPEAAKRRAQELWHEDDARLIQMMRASLLQFPVLRCMVPRAREEVTHA